MKQALQLRLGQHLTMTPQLQQAIRLLQLSTLELQTEIQEALDSNLMLEVDEESNDADNSSNNEPSTSTEEENPTTDDNGETLSETSAAGESEIPEDLPVDTSWDDIYDNISTPTSPSTSSASDNREFEYSGNTEESLHEHLRWQMQLTPFSDTDRAKVELLAGELGAESIDPADVYHTPYPGEEHDALRLTVAPQRGEHMETLAFYFPMVEKKDTELRLHWGETVVPFQITVP